MFKHNKNMIFGYVSDMWNEWNIRSFVMLSLLLQIFLILFSPLRKKTSNHCIIFLLWLAYLMADWVATFTIGLISNKQGNSCAYATEVDKALQAFWVSFLLLHLGGPDNIIAFSLEDSLLWQRHLLNFIFQVAAAIYVFVQIFPNDKSLVIPMILVLLAGIIKNVERTLALYLSSLSRLKESMIQQKEPTEDEDVNNKLVEELKAQRNENSNEGPKLAESTVVKHAYYFFEISKVFLGDLMFTSQQRQMSYRYFQEISAMDALRVISVELHFMYDVLHTKTLAIHSKLSYIFRFIAFAAIVMAFILFNLLKKHNLPETDMRITYCLFFGGITLDVIALFMLVFSDWTIVGMRYNTCLCTQGSFIHRLISAIDDLRMPRFIKCEVDPDDKVTYNVLDTPFIFRRWSESISACNIFSEGLKNFPRMMYKPNQHCGIITFSRICSFLLGKAKILNSYIHKAGETITLCCGLKKKERIIANTNYVCKNPFPRELWIYIFKELKRKSKNLSNEKVRKIFEARGDLFLDEHILDEPNGSSTNLKDIIDLSEYVSKVDYETSVVIWHVATLFCYSGDRKDMSTTGRNDKRNDEREFSKILSDYMLYLILNQPKVMSTVIVTGVACRVMIAEILDRIIGLNKKHDLTSPQVVVGDEEQQILLRSTIKKGCDLAQELKKLNVHKWKVISGVWVEMLSYAAIHIKGETHVQVLSKGGELLAFVWLLMVHLGCFYKHEWGTSYEYHSPH